VERGGLLVAASMLAAWPVGRETIARRPGVGLSDAIAFAERIMLEQLGKPEQ